MVRAIRYRALVLEKPFGLRLKSLEMPRSKRVAKMLYSGVCGTDKHAIRGQLDIGFPVILGHENVAELNGKRVTWPTIIPCNKCENCKIGMENICKRNKLFGINTTRPLTGGWAEYAFIPEDTILFNIPDTIADDVAVLIETMASTKALNQVKLKHKNLLIIGSGPIGLASAVHARYRGAGIVAMTGHKEQARLIGKFIDKFYRKEIPTEELEHEFDIVMDAGGNQASLAYSIRAVKPRGVILESGCMTKNLNFDVSGLVKKELKMFTQLGYVPKDFSWAIKIVEENQRVLKKIITHKFKLSEYKKALDVMFNKKHGKIMFSMKD